MLPRTLLARRLWSASAVLLASAVSVQALRGSLKTYAPETPSYRQKGPPGAEIVIVEFSDLQCPACRFAVAPVKDLLELYGDKARLIFKHFPLDQHALAVPAAIAADCAGRQGKFWEFHDLAYERQPDWNPPPVPGKDGPAREERTRVARRAFLLFARRLGLDGAAFTACLDDPSVGELIEKDRKEADARWVLSTPTFFINGKRFVGARQLAEGGVPWIDKVLKEKK
jgi:protein-disulfide isomerase